MFEDLNSFMEDNVGQSCLALWDKDDAEEYNLSNIKLSYIVIYLNIQGIALFTWECFKRMSVF